MKRTELPKMVNICIVYDFPNKYTLLIYEEKKNKDRLISPFSYKKNASG